MNAKLKEEADAYEQKLTKNIADLDVVDLDLQIEDREATDSEGKPFQYQVALLNNEEYRVPKSVLAQIKAHREANKELQKVKVVKSGTGLSTTYTVIPLK